MDIFFYACLEQSLVSISWKTFLETTPFFILFHAVYLCLSNWSLSSLLLLCTMCIGMQVRKPLVKAVESYMWKGTQKRYLKPFLEAFPCEVIIFCGLAFLRWKNQSQDLTLMQIKCHDRLGNEINRCRVNEEQQSQVPVLPMTVSTG